MGSTVNITPEASESTICCTTTAMVGTDFVGDDLARDGVQPVDEQAAVEVGRAARGKIDGIVLDQQAAVHRPGRLDLTVVYQFAVVGRGPVPPPTRAGADAV